MVERQKRMAIINDLACYGRCALAVSLPIVSALKIECCPLPTALLSSNGAFPNYKMQDTTNLMKAFAEHWEEMDLQFDGICTGFLNSEDQIQIVEQFMERFLQAGDLQENRSGSIQPDSDKENIIKRPMIFVDPVMGDHGRLYSVTSKEVSTEMKRLLKYADVVTPNLTECYILLGREYPTETVGDEELIDIARRISEFGPKAVVITGIPRGKQIQNFIFEKEKGYESVYTEKIGEERSGTGDVFMSVFAGSVLKGNTILLSVKKAALFLNKSIAYTMELGISPRNGVCFEQFLGELGDDLSIEQDS